MRLYDQAKACMTMKDQVMRRWMLHGNISRKGYGNALIGRYGGCYEEDIMRLMMTECIMPRVWMLRRSLHQLPREGQCMVQKRLEIYGWWKCQQSNTRISPKISCTYY